MDFEDLLDEVEDVMRGTTTSGSSNSYSSSSSRKESYSSLTTSSTSAKTSSDRPSYSKTSSTSRVRWLCFMSQCEKTNFGGFVQPLLFRTTLTTCST